MITTIKFKETVNVYLTYLLCLLIEKKIGKRTKYMAVNKIR